VLRACAGGAGLESVLAATTGGDPARADEIRATLAMLATLGFVQVEGGAARPATPPAAPAPQPEDPRVAELRQTLEALGKMEPLDALGLGNRLKVDEADAGAAFREASRKYHPDRFHDAPREVRILAEACFAALNQAHETLASAAGLVDARRLIAARVAGVPYVDHRTYQQARAAYLRGEAAWRVRETSAAAAAFAEAHGKDPHTYEHALMSALAGAMAGTLPVADALARVEPLLAAHPRQAGRTLETLGQLLKLAGRGEEALARFREAVEKDPANHDAQRELRLHEKRTAERTDEKKGFFASLFGRKG
jgi:curved DNA-binding protein CbpA